MFLGHKFWSLIQLKTRSNFQTLWPAVRMQQPALYPPPVGYQLIGIINTCKNLQNHLNYHLYYHLYPSTFSQLIPNLANYNLIPFEDVLENYGNCSLKYNAINRLCSVCIYMAWKTMIVDIYNTKQLLHFGFNYFNV